MIVKSVTQLASAPLFLCVEWLLTACPVYLKIEGLNVAGSIKLKTALSLVESLEKKGVLRPGSSVVESSSGNLGVALAIICAQRGYPFICVGDPNMPLGSQRQIAAFGAKVIIVKERDAQGGYLQSRIDLIQQMLEADSTLIWTNQYANPANINAHYNTTGPEILNEFSAPDWVFIGTGTTGTAMGCARYFRDHSPQTRVVAVDPEGSVTFGGPGGKRLLPGIGTSRRPELVNEDLLYKVLFVAESEAVTMCRHLVRKYGFFSGPSTGSVLAAIGKLADAIVPKSTVIAICPDMGDRYLESMYDDAWVMKNFGSLPQVSV